MYLDRAYPLGSGFRGGPCGRQSFLQDQVFGAYEVRSGEVNAMNHARCTFVFALATLMIAVTQASAGVTPMTLISHQPGVHAFASNDLTGKQASSGANNG